MRNIYDTHNSKVNKNICVAKMIRKKKWNFNKKFD